MQLGATQSEERKSFKPLFLLPWLSSRMSILLRRWATQFLGLEAGLEEDEPDPEVLEEVEDLEGKERVGKGDKKKNKSERDEELRWSNLRFCWLAGNAKSGPSTNIRSGKHGYQHVLPMQLATGRLLMLNK